MAIETHEPLAWRAHRRVFSESQVQEWYEAVGLLLDAQTLNLSDDGGRTEYAFMASDYRRALRGARRAIRTWSERIVELALLGIGNSPLAIPSPQPPKAAPPDRPKAKSKAQPGNRGPTVSSDDEEQGMPDQELDWQEYEPDQGPADPSEPWYARLSVRQIGQAFLEF